MGRQKFTIDGKRLKSLREEKGKTQLIMARELHAKLGMKTNSSDALLRTSYQRNERTGNITRQRANALAEILGVELRILQGEKPSDGDQQDIEIPDSWAYLQQIEQTIHAVLAKGENQPLQQALQQTLAETSFTSGSANENRQDAISYLAEDIAARIEAVQLVRDKNEIAALSTLTGLLEKELLRPANAEGLWFVNIYHREHQSNGFNARSEITQRANWAIGIIREYVEELQRQHPCSDESIRLTQDGFWYRIEIRNPRFRRTVRIDLVRCLPDAKGLRWVKPSWRDEYLIRAPLNDWARANFNFVYDFDGKQSPSGDIRQLRLRVTEYNQSVSRPTGNMVISGHLGEISDERVTSSRDEAHLHWLAQNWLTDELKCALAPFLTDYPRECWSLHGLTIDLDEGQSKNRKRPLLERYLGPKYHIELVEQIGEDKFVPVPWREKDREALKKSIQEMLNDPNHPAWTTDEPRRTFTAYSVEP